MPPAPAADKSLSSDEFVEVLRRKDIGNAHFKQSEYLPAIEAWDACLAVFSGRPGDALQKAEKAKVCANKAEAYLKLERYKEAREACSDALDLDESNFKARFRRARACLLLGGFDDLIMASEDVKRIQADGGKLGEAEAALLKTAQGKQLLPGVGGKSGAVAAAAAMAAATGGSARGDATDEAQKADARARAAAAAAAVAPELELAARLAAEASKAGAEGGRAEAVDVSDGNGIHEARDDGGGDGGGDGGEEDDLARVRARRLAQLKSQAKAGQHGRAATQWQELLRERPPADRYHWLVDSYRTHVDEEFRGAARRAQLAEAARASGLPVPFSPAGAAANVTNGPRASRLSRLSDFLLFCKLCVRCGVVGEREGCPPFDWAALLLAAGGMLHRGFHPEQCGAQHRYGEKAAGDAMRALNAIVYAEKPSGSGAKAAAQKAQQTQPQPQEASATSPVEELRTAIGHACWGEDQEDEEGCLVHRFSFEKGEADGIFEDVGGVQLWVRLNESLKATIKG